MEPATFKREFATIERLVLDEWPSIDKTSLAATEGEFESVVAVVAEATPHTKAVARRKLTELFVEATSVREGKPHGDLRDDLRAGLSNSLNEALDKIEQRVAKLRAEAEASTLPAVKAFAKEHLLFTLLMMLGLGFLLGRALTPRGRRD
jgi:hypothetical protein